MDEVIPPEQFYGFYSIDVENFISQNHTFLLKIPSSQFFNEQLPIFLVWLQKIFQFLIAVPEREKYFPPLCFPHIEQAFTGTFNAKMIAQLLRARFFDHGASVK